MKDGAHIVFHRTLKTRGRPVRAVLLIKRTLDARSDPGRWNLVGGIINSGETPARAARREFGEELSARSKPRIRRLCSLLRGPQGKRATVTYFHAYLPDDMNKLRLKRTRKGTPEERKVEGQGLGWFTEPEVKRLPVRRQDRIALLRFFRGR